MQTISWDIKAPFDKNDRCTVCVNTKELAPRGTLLPDATATVYVERVPKQQDMITSGDSANVSVFSIRRKNTVSCSQDPNALEVTPGCGPSGFVGQTETLTYLVRFQNTGNAPAVYVTIRDPLDPNLDPATLQVIDTSHPLTSLQVDADGALVWSFVNINLPDAATDEPGSHGFVLFSVAARPGLAEGTAISNTASIYFDLNPPVVTNTAVSTVTGAVLPPGGEATAETCNGVDDDCDGQIDNGLGTMTCGVGACQRTVQTCVDGQPVACTAGPPAPETCNGLDDDCNGLIDDGSQASCDDGDGCTTDTCLGPSGCAHAPLPPPDDVGDSVMAASDGTSGIFLSWSIIPNAAHYNSYRGTIPRGYMGSRGAPFDHVCFESGDAAGDGATQSGDPDAPPIGTAFYYLVDGENSCGEGTFGSSSDGSPRPNSSPCPTPP